MEWEDDFCDDIASNIGGTYCRADFIKLMTARKADQKKERNNEKVF
jgi:hypothetical protein